MKVALYYPWIYLTSGAERTILELTRRSRHEWTLFTNHYAPEQTYPGFAQQNVVELPRVPVQRSMGAVARAASKILQQRLPLDGYAALVVVCEGVGDFVVFRNGRVPLLCICLTPLRAVFDSEYRKRALRERGLVKRQLLRVGTGLFRWLDRLAWARYEHVFCISREAERRALLGGLTRRGQVEILHPGLGFNTAGPSGVFKHFFLLPGRIMWTKNIELGIAAFQHFCKAHPEFGRFRLVVAGIVDEKSAGYYENLRRLASTCPNISFRIFPTDDELAELYRSCYGVLFTSFNEDWGIVPLEAMAFGKPVIAVNRGGPRETITHGSNGFLEEPEASAFAARMADIAAHPELAIRVGEAGYQYSRRFSWEQFAQRIDDEVDRVAPESARCADFPKATDVVSSCQNCQN